MPSHPTPKTGNKRRAPMSCDRCKSRKTKCVDPVPGPCQFCSSIGAACHLDPSRRRQRPYYHVSEEEFRYMTKALEHFLPNTELNLQNLRAVVQSFEQSGGSSSGSSSGSSGSSGKTIPDLPPPYSASSESIVVVSEQEATPVSSSSSPSASDHTHQNDGTINEIDELHGELGWLRVDSKGNYRHVGADSGYGFHAAVRSLRKRRRSPVDPALQQMKMKMSQKQSNVVAPGAAASMPDSSSAVTAAVTTGGVPSPRPTPQSLSLSLSTANRRLQIFLPRRDLCNRCVSRFFRDIQSIYWFWSAERFYAVLDRLYAGDPASATPAVLCSLYSILALTCESEAARQMAQLNQMDLLITTEPPPAAKYLSLAKALVPALCDDADADSVRGLLLLGLALQSSMCNNTAYIYIGAAARIALTLGLHLQRASAVEPLKGCLQRQVDLRLYSTLYLLDLDIALCYGNPPAITTDEHATSTPQDLSEQILSPGSHMPLDYLTVSCQVVQIKRQLSKLLYARTRLSSSSSSSPRLSISAVRDSLQSLRTWYANIPPHLRDVARAAPFHQRSVAVLHLRYWSATIFATRPFLLYSALHADACAALPAAKRASFEEFCRTCIDAAKQSLAVVGIMRDAGLQSSLVTLDTGCIIEDLQVFLLALLPSPWRSGSAHAASDSDSDDVRTCLRTLQGMEQILWTHHALTEVMAQLEENGLLNDDNNFSPQSGTDTPSNFFLDIYQQAQAQAQAQNEQNEQAQTQLQTQHQIISGVMEAYFSDLSDPFFDIDDGTAPMLSDHYDAMPGLSM